MIEKMVVMVNPNKKDNEIIKLSTAPILLVNQDVLLLKELLKDSTDEIIE